MARINWEITIDNTLSVEETGMNYLGWGETEEVQTNWQEVQLDFKPSISYTNDSFNDLDDPNTGDEKLDAEINKIVATF